MSKLTKLLSQPGQFVLDSRAYRRLLLSKSQALRAGGPVSNVSIGPADRRADLRRRILEDLGRTVPALDLGDPTWPRVAVLKEHLHHLSEYLADLCHRGGMEVWLRSGKDLLRVADAKLFAVDDFLCDAKEIEAAIGARAGHVRVTFVFEVWKRENGEVVGPQPNPFARRISERTVSSKRFFEPGSLAQVRDLVPHPLPTDVEFPVDVVYTWVNHSDPTWQALYAGVVGHPPEDETDDTRGLDRYTNRDELKFSLRSLAEYAPWVRRIFVVTNCAPPDWLDVGNPKVEWVDHAAILPPEHLPTFSSHAIESRLHHIAGLGDHFLYFNDDFFLMRPALASDFFESAGFSKAFIEDYGSVSGDVDPEDPDYLNAARNGRRLIEDAFRRSVTALHRHTPYALRKDVLFDLEERFREPIAKTTSRRFRSKDDVSTVSFLYHHYAYLTGRAVYAPSTALLIKPQTPKYEGKLQRLLDGAKAPATLCLNDGGGSLGYPHWGRHVVEFLESYFPEKASFER